MLAGGGHEIEGTPSNHSRSRLCRGIEDGRGSPVDFESRRDALRRPGRQALEPARERVFHEDLEHIIDMTSK